MNALVLTIALLGLTISGIAQQINLEIKVTPMNAREEVVVARFDGAALTIAKVNRKPVPVPLLAKNSESINKAISAVPVKQWNGFWASSNHLDGSILTARLELDGKKFEFEGMNGCPPKFAMILAAIYDATKEPLFTGGWEEIEKSSKRYESLDAFAKAAAKSS